MEKFERIYNVPLGDAYLTTRVKATRRAVKILRQFIRRHAKVEEENVKLSNKLNSFIWSRGRKKPPRHVKIKVIKDGDVARAYLHDEKIEEKKVEEKKPEEKKEQATAEKKEEVKEEIKTEKKAPAGEAKSVEEKSVEEKKLPEKKEKQNANTKKHQKAKQEQKSGE